MNETQSRSPRKLILLGCVFLVAFGVSWWLRSAHLIGSQPTGVNVTITSPTSADTLTGTSPLLTLTGRATSSAQIVSMSWTSDRGSSGSASGTSNWTAENIPLLAGTNVITVTATDSLGNTGSDVLTVTVNSFQYVLAEGATGPFFNLEVLLANPNAVATPVKLTFLKPDGSKVEQSFDLPALSDRRVVVNDIAGLESTAVSTVVESTTALPLIVERSMLWDRASSYAGHGDAAVSGPAQKWFFAEGSQGYFDTYLLIANANAVPANVTVQFLTEFNGTVSKTFNIGPTSRFNVYAGDYPELADKSFSIVVDSDQPIIAERAMYFGDARLWDGGHESAGVREPATSWFLAEGATGPFFDTYILVANPNDASANLSLKYLLSTGQTVTKTRSVPAHTRLTVNVEEEDPLLANAAVSTTVTSDIPIVVERAMYWPGVGGSWYEAHNSFGVTTTGTKWGLAEGRVGNAVGNGLPFETYILLANPTTSPATVQITFLRSSGAPIVKDFTVQPTSRFNVYVNEAVPELQNEVFGAVIESINDVPIAVERAMYWNALGQQWTGGTNATGTRLPDVGAAAVTWSPNQINIVLSPGETATRTVTFNSNVNLQNVVIESGPVLSPFVTITPNSFADVPAASQKPVELTFAIPPSTPLGAYEAALHVRNGSQTLFQTLSVSLDVWQVFLSSELGLQLKYPPGWEVETTNGELALYDQSSVAAAARGDAVVPADVTITVLDNPQTLALHEFIVTYEGGWYADYDQRTALTVSGEPALLLNDLQSAVPSIPGLAVFIPSNDHTIVIVTGLESVVTEFIAIVNSMQFN